jgi:hypothetical protein
MVAGGIGSITFEIEAPILGRIPFDPMLAALADELELGPGDSGQGSRLRLVKFIQA